jgi:hypothetical protein
MRLELSETQVMRKFSKFIENRREYVLMLDSPSPICPVSLEISILAGRVLRNMQNVRKFVMAVCSVNCFLIVHRE